MSQDQHVKKIALRKGKAVFEMYIKSPNGKTFYLAGKLNGETKLVMQSTSFSKAAKQFDAVVAEHVAARYRVLSAWTIDFTPAFGFDNGAARKKIVVERLKYQRLLKAATVLAGAVGEIRPNLFPGNPLDDARNELDEVVRANEGDQLSRTECSNTA